VNGGGEPGGVVGMPSPFPPIREYAFLSDCEANALVAPGGAVEWMCLPRPDSPSVFGAMLDRTAGSFVFAPEGTDVPQQRRYLPGSLVLETTWMTPTGWVQVHDCLVMQPWKGERSSRYWRAPADFAGEAVLLRIATCIDGDAEIALDCLPLFNYGRDSMAWSYAEDGYGTAVAKPTGEGLDLRLTTNLRLGLTGARAYGHTQLTEGQGVFAALAWDIWGPTSLEEARDLSNATSHYWRQWLKGGTFPDHPWRIYLARSALTLKGLSYAPTGAILAAPTTSLPETPGGERNWDYRYTWIRDSAFMLSGLFELGFEWEAFEYYAFLIQAVGGNPLQIMYGIDGERELPEKALDHLSGYDGARPVRIGNAAYNQKQHDVWGMLLDSIATHSGHGLAQQLPATAWEFISSMVEAAAAQWQEPDRGIWEVRGEPKHFTASKVLCWVALDRGAKLAETRSDGEQAQAWRKVADEIHAEICKRGVDDRGVFVQHYDTKELDASLLLIPIMGFLPPEDQRVKKTVLAIADELTDHGLVLRYRVEQTDDGLSGEEGTFTICSFWLVSALTQIGEIERARELCEKLLALASPLQLYAEELDAASGRHLGNFPQAFTHLALIDAVTKLIDAETQTMPA
jgi:alpha,alpha-trehalase